MGVLSIVLFLHVIGMCNLAQEREPKGLLAFVAKDLRKLDKMSKETFRRDLAALSSDRAKTGDRVDFFEPWWVNAFSGGKVAWLYLEVHPGYDVPDVSGFRAGFFDSQWKYLSSQVIPTGYRLVLIEAAIRKENPLKQDLLVAEVESRTLRKRKPGDAGRLIVVSYRQYYAPLNGTLVLIRLENEEAHVVQNGYMSSVPSIGPPVPRRSRAEWISSLKSENPAETLATLVWLSGAHLSSAEPRRKGLAEETVDESAVLESVRDSAECGAALRKLAVGKNPWVREYAEFAIANPGKDGKE